MTEGENIRAARKKAKLTQKELAEKSGLATITIQQYERNLREPRLENIKKIANALDVSVDSLFGDSRIGLMTEFDLEKWDFIYPGIFEEGNTRKLNELFKALNNNGQNKAIEQVELLTKIPEYRKGNPPE